MPLWLTKVRDLVTVPYKAATKTEVVLIPLAMMKVLTTRCPLTSPYTWGMEGTLHDCQVGMEV